MKLDVLVFAAHPDDAELACSGTILSLIDEGKKVGVIDLTRGELGTRGTAATREIEAQNSAAILGLSVRENLDLGDGYFEIKKETIGALCEMLRKYRPDMVLANAPEDRHPDHGRAGELAFRACFMSGLPKVKTNCLGVDQEAWRPAHLFHYIQDRYLSPDFVLDISAFWDKKRASILAFKTQFFAEEGDGPETYISSPEFFASIKARNQELGHSAGFALAEGFVKSKQIGLKSFSQLL